jgi:hypothetical protein
MSDNEQDRSVWPEELGYHDDAGSDGPAYDVPDNTIQGRWRMAQMHPVTVRPGCPFEVGQRVRWTHPMGRDIEDGMVVSIHEATRSMTVRPDGWDDIGMGHSFPWDECAAIEASAPDDAPRGYALAAEERTQEAEGKLARYEALVQAAHTIDFEAVPFSDQGGGFTISEDGWIALHAALGRLRPVDIEQHPTAQDAEIARLSEERADNAEGKLARYEALVQAAEELTQAALAVNDHAWQPRDSDWLRVDDDCVVDLARAAEECRDALAALEGAEEIDRGRGIA